MGKRIMEALVNKVKQVSQFLTVMDNKLFGCERSKRYKLENLPVPVKLKFSFRKGEVSYFGNIQNVSETGLLFSANTQIKYYPKTYKLNILNTEFQELEIFVIREEYNEITGEYYYGARYKESVEEILSKNILDYCKEYDREMVA